MDTKNLCNPINILLVEDNPGDVRLTKEALCDNKIINNLFIAEDGEQALDFLFRENGFDKVVRPDLILLDLNLPKKSGIEVLHEIKNNELLKRIPVIVLTTSRAEEDIIKSYNYHANCYISKPLNLENFIKVIRSIENFWLSIVKLPKDAA